MLNHNRLLNAVIVTSIIQPVWFRLRRLRDIAGFKYQRKSCDCVTEKKANELKICETNFGDVIISKVGDPPCNAAVYDDTQRAIITQDVIRIRPSRDVNPWYLSMIINSGMGKRRVHEIVIDGTRKRVSLTEFKKIRFPKPSKNEQDAIAATIICWDRAIDLTERLIAVKQERRTWLMQQLLTGKRRLPGFDKLWKEVRIGDFMKESRIPGSHGKSARKITVKLYGLGVLPKSDVREGSENTKYYTRKAGQFIYSKLDFLNGAFGIVPEVLDGFESTLDLPCFDFRGNLEPKFLLNLVSRDAFYSRFLGSAMGGVKRAGSIHLSSFPFR